MTAPIVLNAASFVHTANPALTLAASAKATRPIYNYALISVSPLGVLSVHAHGPSASYLGHASVSDGSAALTTPLMAVVEGRRLAAVLANLHGDDDVRVYFQDEWLELRQGAFKARLPLYTTEPFPEFERGDVDPFGSVEFTGPIIDGLRRVSACTGKDKGGGGSNQVHGPLFDFETPGVLRFAGYAARQLHVFEVPLDTGLLKGMKFSLERSAVDLLVALYQSSEEGDVTIDVFPAERVIVASTPEATLRMNWVSDGGYPQNFMLRMGADAYRETGRFFFRTGANPDAEPEPRWYADFDVGDLVDALASSRTVLEDSDIGVTMSLTDFAQEENRIVGRCQFVGRAMRTKATADRTVFCEAEAKNSITCVVHKDRARESLREVRTNRVRAWFHSPMDPILVSEIPGSADDLVGTFFVVVSTMSAGAAG